MTNVNPKVKLSSGQKYEFELSRFMHKYLSSKTFSAELETEKETNLRDYFQVVSVSLQLVYN